MRLTSFLVCLAILVLAVMAPPGGPRTALTPTAVRPVLTPTPISPPPTERNLAATRQAWREARVPYQQTEVFRFGNTAVDDWEDKVNAWPLDEGLIDYVDMSRYGDDAPDNPCASANVIAHPLLRIGGRTVDTRVLDRAALERLHELDGVEANVARGYHAIEFLLWGQDLNGTGADSQDRQPRCLFAFLRQHGLVT